MKVIVTRPRREADAWVKQLRDLQIDAVALSLIHISPPPDTSSVARVWQNLHQYSALMFVSSNAVRYFYPSNEHLSGVKYDDDAIKYRAWATGPGTREALLAASVPADAIDAPAADAPQFDSEALWRRVQTQVKAGDKVLIVRGCSADPQNTKDTQDGENAENGAMNGRPWLADQLTALGVQVDFVVSYQRRAPVFDAAEQALMAQARVDGSLWLLSSSEAVANLTSTTAAAAVDWSQARALATHPRIAQAAREAGFGVVYVSRPLLADVVASIESLL
ncbi:MAG: uroporphyrinogen-III synthase [Burkholderiaceae bacterium]